MQNNPITARNSSIGNNVLKNSSSLRASFSSKAIKAKPNVRPGIYSSHI